MNPMDPLDRTVATIKAAKRRHDAWQADGLYRVVVGNVVAGFVIKDGVIERCAPVLRRNFDRWLRYAERISP